LANIAVPEFPSPARDYVRGNKKLMAYIRRVADPVEGGLKGCIPSAKV
jgi:hypothetical protein